MKKPIICTVIVVAISLLVLTGFFVSGGCRFKVTPDTTISDVKVCTSLKGNLCNQENLVFSITTQTIYASCLLKNSPSKTRVKFTWIYHGETKVIMDSAVLITGGTQGNIEINSILSQPINGWSKGTYEVMIQLETDSANPLIKQFSIK